MKNHWLIGRIFLCLVLAASVTYPIVAHAHEEEGPVGVGLSHVHMKKALDPAEGEKRIIEYTLSEPARVRIRVRARGTRELYLATIVDWEYRDAGSHTEVWDLKNYSGYPVDPKRVATKIKTESMATYAPGTIPREEYVLPKDPEELIHGHPHGHTHNKHHEWACKTAILTILSPKEDEVLSGRIWVKARVDKERRGYGDFGGYGVRYYVDYELTGEQMYRPESKGEFAYQLDTTAFEDGEHMLYVGMCDHQDHGTSASVRVTFDNTSPTP